MSLSRILEMSTLRLIKLGIWELGFAVNTSYRAIFRIVIVLHLCTSPMATTWRGTNHLTIPLNANKLTLVVM